mmetsp:Transcript_5808/g.5035  ORF Transcript_5808/g.5035 Transcript_5808/m.5035 type:complete len:82 (+) Transcript_5808:300-545(+)
MAIYLSRALMASLACSLLLFLSVGSQFKGLVGGFVALNFVFLLASLWIKNLIKETPEELEKLKQEQEGNTQDNQEESKKDK